MLFEAPERRETVFNIFTGILYENEAVCLSKESRRRIILSYRNLVDSLSPILFTNQNLIQNVLIRSTRTPPEKSQGL
jgi:hypothetical protein